MSQGDKVTFFHNDGVAVGIVNGEPDEHCVPVYLLEEDRQLYVLRGNVLA
jgi:hypothetical protein